MRKIKILNLHAGLGGNAKKWNRDVFEVTAVELEPKIAKVYQENNPEDSVVIGDAMAVSYTHLTLPTIYSV